MLHGEDGDKEKIEKAVQDALGLVRQESEAEKYRNEVETNKAKIKAKKQSGELRFHREKHPQRGKVQGQVHTKTWLRRRTSSGSTRS